MNKRNSQGKTSRKTLLGKYLLGMLSVLICVLVVSSLTANVLAEEVSGSLSDPASSACASAAPGESVAPQETAPQESYTVTFTYGEGAVLGEAQTVAAGSYAAQPDAAPPAPEGKVFAGWYAEGASEPFDFAATPITADTTLVAGWQDAPQMAPARVGGARAGGSNVGGANVGDSATQTVIVTFVVDGDIYDEVEVIRNTLVDLPVLDAAPDGTPFLGWFVQGETAPFASTRLVEGDITLVARYSENRLVTFVDSTGLVMQAVEVAAGESLSDHGYATQADLPAPTVPPGQEFLYWAEASATSAFDVTAPVTAHVTLVPHLKEQALAVFVTNGSEVDPQTGPEGFSPDRPAVTPTRTGYTFAGWFTQPNGGGSAVYFANDASPAQPPITIAGTVFIYAKWAPKTVGYTVNVWVEKKDIENPGDPLVDGTADYEVQYTTTKTAPADSEVSYTETQARALTDALPSGTYARNLVTYSDFKASEKKSISPNGDTVINVFFTRMVFTYTFDPRYNGTNFNGAQTFPDATLETSAGPVQLPYVMTAKVEQTVQWPSAVNLNQAGNYFTNWSGYYGLRGYMPVSFTDISVAMTSANNTVSSGHTAIVKPQQRDIMLYAGSTAAPFTEMRHYYVEMTEAEKQAYLDNGGADTHGSTGTLPDGTLVRVWQAGGPSDYSGTVRFYKYSASGASSYQNSNPSTNYTGWPGRMIEGFEQIGALKDFANYKYVTTQYFAEYEVIGKNEANKDSYYLYYYMPRKSYTVTLVANGGSVANLPSAYDSSTLKASVVYEGSIPLPSDADVTRSRFAFEGWYTDEGLTKAFDPNTTMPVKDLTLFAKWRGTAITVRYRDGGAQDVAAHTYDDNEALLAHDLAGTRYEHAVKGETIIEGKGVFQGWYYTVGTGAAAANIEFPLGINLTRTEYILTAKFTDIIHTVMFKGNEDGTPMDYGTIANISTGKTLAQSGHFTPKPTRTFYTLLGWSTQEGAATPNFTAATPVTKDMTVYAVWRPNNFDLTYDPGDQPDAAGMPDPLTVSVMALNPYKLAAGPTTEAYNFVGWKSSVNGQTYKVGGTPNFIMHTEEVTMTAQWEIKKYTVRFDAGWDLVVPPATGVEHGTTTSAPGITSFEGGTLEGWYKDAACTQRWNFDSDVVKKNITLYAKWNLYTYTVTFDTQGGSYVAPYTEVPYGSRIVAPGKAPWKDGFAYRGWFLNTEFKDWWNFEKDVVKRDVTLYALWAVPKDKYIVEFNGNGADVGPNPGSMEAYKGEALGSLPAAPSREGYLFAGWNTSPDGSGSGFGAATPVHGDMVVYAQWTAAEDNGAADGESGLPAQGTGAGGGDGEDTAYTTQLNNGKVPLMSGDDHWALANLILAAAAVLTTLCALVLYFVRRRKDEQTEDGEAEQKPGGKRLWTRIAAAGVSAVSAAVFLLTENMHLDMAITDKWTLLMALLFVGAVALVLLGGRKKDSEEAGHTGRVAYDK